MSHIIASMDETHAMQMLTLDQKGNKYRVGLYDGDIKSHTHRDFDNINSAEAMFKLLASCLIHGDYSYETRADMLLNTPSA